MLKPTYILGATLMVSMTNAQQPFSKAYTGFAGSRSLVELSSGNLLTGLSNSEEQAICTSLMTSEGDVIHTSCYSVETAPGNIGSLLNLKRRSNNDICFTTSVRVNGQCSPTGWNRRVPAIGSMDSLGNILSINHYDFNTAVCSTVPDGIEVTSDDGVIAFGGYSTLFALKADGTGQLLWAKRYSEPGRFTFIKELSNGELLGGLNIDYSGGCVARMDAEGNFIWIRSFFRPTGIITDAVAMTDGTFVISGFTESNIPAGSNPPPGYDPKIFAMGISADGEMIWCKQYDAATWWKDGV